MMPLHHVNYHDSNHLNLVNKIMIENLKSISMSSDSQKITCVDTKLIVVPHEPARYGVGLDVHKDSVVVCVKGQLSTGEIYIVHQHTFKNDSKGLQEMTAFLRKFDTNPTYLMECTGVYHIPVVWSLKEAFPKFKDQIIAMNPLLVHNRISSLGNKHDKADAQSMASLAFYDDIIKPSYVGSESFYTVRNLMRAYHRNQQFLTKVKNRIHTHLCAVNQKFPFNLSTEWSLHLLDRYCSQDWTLEEAYNSYFAELKEEGKSAVLSKHYDMIHRNGSVNLSKERRFLIQLNLLRFLNIQEAGTVLLTRAEELILTNKGLALHYECLLSVPGFGTITVLTLLTELGDYSRFGNCAGFTKFCGVVPGISQSGNTKVKGHINRFSNKIIRTALCQAAGSVINRKDQTTDLGKFAFRQRYQRNLPFKKAMIKVAQKMARTAFRILAEKRVYDPTIELMQKQAAQRKKRLKKSGSLLENAQTRALRRDIQSFLVSHSTLLNSSSHFHLVAGFKKLIKRSHFKASQDLPNPEKGRKFRKRTSKEDALRRLNKK
jgi:transposase